MSLPFLTPIDLQKNELQNARIQNLAADPALPVVGQIYYNTNDLTIRQYNGSLWRVIGFVGATTPQAAGIGASASAGSSLEVARADHVHATPALATTSVNGFMAATDKTLLTNATASPTVSTMVIRDANGRAQFADPAAAQDAATMGYVDGKVNGYRWKQSVRAVAASAITLSGTQTIDGVAVIAGDRVLVTAQASAPTNGIYVVAAGAWSRSVDADAWTELVSASVLVEEGTTYADTGWNCTVNAGGTLGTTNVTWIKFINAVAGTVTNVGGTGTVSGLTLTGTVTTSGNLTLGGTLAVVPANINGGTGASSSTYLRGDGQWATPAGGVSKYAVAVGDGSATSITVTHNLNSRDVTVALYQAGSPFAQVMCDVAATTVNTVTLAFATAPTAGQYRCVVTG